MSDKKIKYFAARDVSLAGKPLKKGDSVQMTEANGKRLLKRGIICHDKPKEEAKPKADTSKADK